MGPSESKKQQLQTQNEEATQIYNTYQNKSISFKNKFDHECTNAEVLQNVAANAEVL
jgi:myosin-crossreactive antigen